MTEVIIFAGSDAWAQCRSSGRNRTGDWLAITCHLSGLGEQQLAELDNLQIVPDGRYRVRLYQAGLLRPGLVNTIGQKLAAAGVRDADYDLTDAQPERENWREYLEREVGES